MNRRILAAALAAALLLAATLSAADWPQFRGPDRDAKSTETGLLKTWPADGPKLLWTATGCGAGYGSPSISGSTIYLTGDVDGKACVLAFDLDGKLKNHVAFGKENTVDPTKYFGTRSTPTVEGGFVYVAGAFGEMACLDAKTLTQSWQINIREKFTAKTPQWEYADSPLVDGENLICTPGGANASIVALNKKTGETVWTSQGLSDRAAYASCAKMTVDKLPMIVTMTHSGLVGVNAKTGQFLWRNDRAANKYPICSSPVFSGNRIFGGNGLAAGAVDLTVADGAVTAAEAWTTKDMLSRTGGFVLVDGYVYGSNSSSWACIDFKTGQKKWNEPGVGMGSLLYADGLLYTVGETSHKVALVKASPEGFTVVSEFPLPQMPGLGKDPLWAYPAIANGRLYIRFWDVLFCYDIRGDGKVSSKPSLPTTYHNPAEGDMHCMDQQTDLPEVRRKLPQISKGLAIQKVLEILGPPAMISHNEITYYPLDKGCPVLNSKDGEVDIQTDGETVTGIEDFPDSTGRIGVGGGGSH
jgi:outer membrane protein assembly factor BamB